MRSILAWRQSLLAFVLAGFVLPLPYAVDAQVTITNPLRAQTFEDLFLAIATFLWNIALAVGLIMVVIAGFLFVTAAGDPNRVRRAKEVLLYTVIGIVVIGISRGLIKVLQSFFTVSK